MKSPTTIAACLTAALALLPAASQAQTTRPAASQPTKAAASVSLSALLNPHFASVPVRDKEALITDIAAGIDPLVEKENDPAQLSKYAKALQLYGCAGPVNDLEYWGENPQIQAHLRPIAEAVVKLLDKAAKITGDQSNALQNQIGDGDDPRVKQWQDLDQKARSARYNEIFAIYAMAISLDKADVKRKELCDKTIKAAGEFDDPTSGVQAACRVCMGKLAMVESPGNPEAMRLFDAVIADPKAEVGDAYQARYFRAVTALGSGRLDEASKALADTRAWSKANLSADIQGVDSAAAALEFRIDKAQAESAATPEAKSKARVAAVAVLRQLWVSQPAVRNSIRESVSQDYLADLKAALEKKETH